MDGVRCAGVCAQNQGDLESDRVEKFGVKEKIAT